MRTISLWVLAAFIVSTWYSSGFDALMLAVSVISSIAVVVGGIFGIIALAIKWAIKWADG